MTTGPIVLFSGPSLSHEAAASLAPDALLRPPARLGDVVSAVQRLKPHAIGLLDCAYGSVMSVLHKELLYAMDAGIWVVGASGVGALRAAECRTYGMIGVGSVYQAVVSGVIEDDDEVLCAFGGEQDGYRAHSDSLVRIRATIRGLLDEDLLTEAEAAALQAAQRRRWYPHRSLSALPLDAIAVGIDESRAARITDVLAARRWDPAHDDAVALLARMAGLPAHPIPVADRPGVAATRAFHVTLNRDLVVEDPGGHRVSLDEIRKFALLNLEDARDASSTAQLKVAVGVVSRVLHGPLSEAELESGAHCLARRRGVERVEVSSVLAALDVDPRGIDAMTQSEAHVVRMERSALAMGHSGAMARAFLDELRLRGSYDSVRRQAALELAAAARITFDAPPTAATVLQTYAAISGWSIPEDLEAYAEARDLGSVAELLESLSIAIRASDWFFETGFLARTGETRVEERPTHSRTT